MQVPVRPNYWMRLLYPKAVWRGDPFRPQIYLTFDDGPVPQVTPEVLDILKDTAVKATFFCIGDNVRKSPEIFRRILQEGHLAGNHTFRHVNGFKTATATYLSDVNDCANLVDSHFFRPPYGRMKPGQYQALKSEYKLIMWDVLSKDYDRNLSPQQCRDNVLNYCRNGSVIVCHDSIKAADNLLPVLHEMICRLKEKFTFSTIDTLSKRT